MTIQNGQAKPAISFPEADACLLKENVPIIGEIIARKTPVSKFLEIRTGVLRTVLVIAVLR